MSYPTRNNRIAIGCLKVSTSNLGDYIQILACLALLEGMNLRPNIFVDRDTELAILPALDRPYDRLLLPLNGWFKLQVDNDPQWPPHEKIIPLFFGFHVRPHACPALLESRSLEYMKTFEPIGCRDPFTMDLLRSRGLSSYLTNCLSLTLPRRSAQWGADKVFIVSNSQDIVNIVPREIHVNHIYINHYQELRSFDAYIAKARALIDLYRTQARLVITTFLHCALPCIAMGIPVIVFYPSRKGEFWNVSDQVACTRFG